MSFPRSFLFLLSLLVWGVLITNVVLAGDYGLEETAGAAELKTIDTVPKLIGNVIGTALSLIAVLFFGLMIFGGFLWMTAHGKEEQETKARDLIIAAVIGVIIVLASYAITKFVFKSVEDDGGKPTKKLNEECQVSALVVSTCETFQKENDCKGDCAWKNNMCNAKGQEECFKNKTQSECEAQSTQYACEWKK